MDRARAVVRRSVHRPRLCHPLRAGGPGTLRQRPSVERVVSSLYHVPDPADTTSWIKARKRPRSSTQTDIPRRRRHAVAILLPGSRECPSRTFADLFSTCGRSCPASLLSSLSSWYVAAVASALTRQTLVTLFRQRRDTSRALFDSPLRRTTSEKNARVTSGRALNPTSSALGHLEDKFLSIALRIAAYPVALILVNGIITGASLLAACADDQSEICTYLCREASTQKQYTFCTACTTFCTVDGGSSSQW
jgi:hypothetical protein